MMMLVRLLGKAALGLLAGLCLLGASTGQCDIDGEPNLTQELILACYDLNVEEVVSALRSGARVNGRLGKLPFDHELAERVNGMEITPLMALAQAPQSKCDLAKTNRKNCKDEPNQNCDTRQKRSGTGDGMAATKVETILWILLACGCEIDLSDSWGATALFFAAQSGKVVMVRELLRRGANPNVKVGAYIDGPSDRTPLHVCSHAQAAQLLLQYGADPYAKDSYGQTPIDWHKKEGYVSDDDENDFELLVLPDGVRVVLTRRMKRQGRDELSRRFEYSLPRFVWPPPSSK